PGYATPFWLTTTFPPLARASRARTAAASGSRLLTRYRILNRRGSCGNLEASDCSLMMPPCATSVEGGTLKPYDTRMSPDGGSPAAYETSPSAAASECRA